MQDISRALEQTKNEFRNEIDAAISISTVFISDFNMNEIIEEEYDNAADYVEVYDKYIRRILNNYTAEYNSMQNIKIYLDNPTLLHSGAIGFLSPEAKESVWYKALSSNDASQPVLIRTSKEDLTDFNRVEGTRDTFSIVRRLNSLFSTNNWEKILKIELRMQTINQVFSNLNLPGAIYLLNDKGYIEYTTDPLINWETTETHFDDMAVPQDMIKFETDYSDVNYLQNWRIIGLVSDDVVISEVRKSREFVIWLALGNLVVSTLIIIWITQSINVRLANILKHMKKVKNQQFDMIKGDETQDEIGQLTGEFNRMTHQIRSLISDVYVADIQKKSLELERRQAQLNALQSQINPHFLFNALETIRMRSLIKNETETAKIIHNMAKIFRSSLTWNRDKITIDEEMEFIYCFLEIQKYRFGDRMDYKIDIDPEASECTVPKMVFLPFVENASIHGIEPLKSGGRIELSIRIKDDSLIFSISDNGVGMEQEQVARIYNYIGSDEELGDRIGVQNVIYRLRMIYGARFDLVIDSAPAKGTFIQITLPID